MEFHILDTETASLQGGVVEIAFLVVDEQMNVQSEFHSLVDPQRPIEPGAQAVHGISAEDVAGKPTLESIADMIGDNPIKMIGHNVSFDKRMIGPHIQVAEEMCTLELAREFIKGTTNHKLETLQKELSLPDQKSHSALGDVYTCLYLLQHIVNVTGLDFKTLWARAQRPKMVQRMPFGKHKGTLISNLPRSYRDYMLTLDINKDLRYTLETLKAL